LGEINDQLIRLIDREPRGDIDCRDKKLCPKVVGVRSGFLIPRVSSSEGVSVFS
jgi:hypothetical protein